jgi:hypothetical protein
MMFAVIHFITIVCSSNWHSPSWKKKTFTFKAVLTEADNEFCEFLSFTFRSTQFVCLCLCAKNLKVVRSADVCVCLLPLETFNAWFFVCAKPLTILHETFHLMTLENVNKLAADDFFNFALEILEKREIL